MNTTPDLDQPPYDTNELAEILAAWMHSPRQPGQQPARRQSGPPEPHRRPGRFGSDAASAPATALPSCPAASSRRTREFAGATETT